MRIPHSALPVIRLTVLIAFTLVSALIFGYLWVNSGGTLPLSKERYQVTASFPEVANLVPQADVMVAGVPVGAVTDIRVKHGRAYATMELNEEYPVHKGATVQVRNKTLVEETFLEISDGNGRPLPDGATLPEKAGKPPVTLDDVLASLTPETRRGLASTIRSLGLATKGSRESVSRALTGLGYLGREGQGALAALAAQSEDLKKLVGKSATLLAALDTSQGQITQLVSATDTLTRVTANGDRNIKTVMRKLPGVMDSATNAADDLNRLSGDLAPVASNLKAAAPDLSAALRELPQTASDLHGLLPSLDGVLDKAPQTLARTPMLADDAQRIIPTARAALAEVNPMLAYLRPYGRDVAALFTNMAQTLGCCGSKYGAVAHLLIDFDAQSWRGLPFNLNTIGPLNKYNPYPEPGTAGDPRPFEGKYDRVKRDHE